MTSPAAAVATAVGHGPPVRLRCVLLSGIGPADARFDPFTLDFSVGDRAADRGMVSLSNTGGKTTLLTIVLSVISPSGRAQVASKSLGDYVLTGDTAHAVLEFDDDTTGDRIVIGTVMEWRDQRVQPTKGHRTLDRLHRSWYLFRTARHVAGGDLLQFVTDGRRTTHSRFVAALGDLFADDPHVRDGRIVRTQSDWRDALRDLTPIDPVLYGHQQRMNDAESSAEKLLERFTSDDSAVRWLLESLSDASAVEEVIGQVRTYAEQAGKRPHFETTVAFGEELTPLLVTLADRTDRRNDAERAVVAANVAADDTVRSVQNRLDIETDDLAIARDVEKAAAESAEAAMTYRTRLADARDQIRLEAARWAHTDAEEHLEAAKEAVADAEAHLAAWDAVSAVVALERARDHARRTRDAYERANAGLGDLRADTEAAADAYAGRLDAAIAGIDDLIVRSETAEQDARTAGKEAERSARDARAALDGAQRDLDDDDATIAAAAGAATDAVAAGHVDDGERASDAARRWARALAGHEQTAARANTLIGALDTEIERLDDELGALTEAVTDAVTVHRQATDRRRRWVEDLDGLRCDAWDELTDGTDPDPAHFDGVDTAAAAAIADGDDHVARLTAQALAANDELGAIRGTGTVPGSADAIAVARVCLDADIGAVPGLEWVEANVIEADRRAAFIEDRPDVAGGVVVTDPARFDAAVAAVTAAVADTKITTRTPVTMTVPPAPTSAAAADGPGPAHVVVPHRATWDRDWASRREAELEETVIGLDVAIVAATDRVAALRTLRSEIGRFRRAWAATAHAELDTALDRAEGAVTDARGALDANRDRKTAAAGERSDARAELTAAEEAIAGVGVHRAAVADLAEAEAAAADATNRREEIVRRFEQARAGIAAAEQAEEVAARAEQEARKTLDNARSRRGELGQERRAVPVDGDRPDPGGNLDVRRDRWSDLRERLSRAEAGIAEAYDLDAAERTVGERHAVVAKVASGTIREAERLAGTVAAADDAAIAESRAAAAAKLEAADDERRRRKDDVADTARAVKERSPSTERNRVNFIDLSGSETVVRYRPVDADDVDRVLALVTADLQVAARERTRTENELREATEARRVLDDLVAGFSTALDGWVGDEPGPGNALFDGTPEEARRAIRDAARRVHDAEQNLTKAGEAQGAAMMALKSAAAGSRWGDVDAEGLQRIRNLTETQILAEVETLTRRFDAQSTSARGQLEMLDGVRDTLRVDLHGLCKRQLRTLGQLQAESKLPATLGGLAGHPTIKIGFTAAPDDEAAARLADRLDRWAVEISESPSRAKGTDAIMSMVADATADCVVRRPKAGPFKVEVLKPYLDGRVTYRRPRDIRDEFSGGQALTLAVLVYCALAGVRGRTRPGGRRPPGTLFLDNPFGRASAPALIEIQQTLAAAVGIQLVYATGIGDPGVLHSFSTPGSAIVKVKNDAVVRRNRSHLHVDDRIVADFDIDTGLTGNRDASDPRSHLTAAPYQLRVPSPDATPPAPEGHIGEADDGGNTDAADR